MNQGGEVLGGEEVFGAGKLYKENVADKGTSDQKGGQNGQNCDFIGLFFGFWGWLPWSGFDHLWRRVWGGWGGGGRGGGLTPGGGGLGGGGGGGGARS